MSTRRVVITGMGTINPLGLSVQDYWTNLAAGEAASASWTASTMSTMSSRVGGQVPEFDHMPFFKDQKMARRLDRAIIYGHVAASQAMRDSGLQESGFDPERAGVTIGTGMGGVSTFEARGPRVKVQRGHKRVSPFFIPMILPNTVPAYFAIENNLQGPNFTILSACASANHSMGEAFEIVKRGDADIMFAGGVRVGDVRGHLCRLRQHEGPVHPQRRSRRRLAPVRQGPRRLRDGRGRRRAGARGAGACQDAAARASTPNSPATGRAATPTTSPPPHPEGAGRLPRHAATPWPRPRMNPGGRGLVNAHGTSTPLGDVGETKAIKNCFGDHAKQADGPLHQVHDRAHALGAAGGVEAVALMMALVQGHRPSHHQPGRTGSGMRPGLCAEPGAWKRSVRAVLSQLLRLRRAQRQPDLQALRIGKSPLILPRRLLALLRFMNIMYW